MSACRAPTCGRCDSFSRCGWLHPREERGKRSADLAGVLQNETCGGVRHHPVYVTGHGLVIGVACDDFSLFGDKPTASDPTISSATRRTHLRDSLECSNRNAETGNEGMWNRDHLSASACRWV